MSKMSELDLCISELRSAAQSIMAVADGLAALFSGDGKVLEHSEATVSKPEKVGHKPVTLEMVRVVLAEKSRAGRTAQVRELLERHGAAKLSEIDPAEYRALLKEAEALANG